MLVDPLRLALPDQGAADYVYRKQLEEAELVGLTKLDAVDSRLGDATLHRLRQRFGPNRVLPLAAASGQGVLTVRDSGPGIASAALGRIFEPFYTTREGGLGLGLSLSESLALAMNGRLSAANREPRGAELSLTLPLA